MAKLWQKGYELNDVVERFSVGNDYLLDRRLVAADAISSIAHARMLASIDLLNKDDANRIVAELRVIAAEAVGTGVTIERGQEDSHTWIEERLVERLGEAGKRIHTGRSRNDQVAASTRLFAREGALLVRRQLLNVAGTLVEIAETHRVTVMPGRTHLQAAMPSTFGLWASCFAELLLDADAQLEVALQLVNRSPLGAAASYGVPLPLNRELVADLLGFDGVHHNVLAAVSSRGQIEAALLGALEAIAVTLSRFATDLILFSLPEFAYVRLPDELTTGSSIMPQKKNPDGLELLRGKATTMSALGDRARGICRSLPSSYNRDVQESKEPLLAGIDLAVEMLAVTQVTLDGLQIDAEKMRDACPPELFATDVAIERVAAGESFRDAYVEVAQMVANGEIEVPLPGEIDAMIRRRTSTGTPGNLDLDTTRADLRRRAGEADALGNRISAAVTALAGNPIDLYPGMPD